MKYGYVRANSEEFISPQLVRPGSHQRFLPKKHPLWLVYASGEILSHGAAVMEPKAHRNGLIHLVHLIFIQAAHMLPKPLFIDGSDLLQ